MAQEENAAVAIYDGHWAAEAAIRRLVESAFDMRKVSVAGREDLGSGQLIGYYQSSGSMKYWGRLGRFWGTLWGLLAGWAFFDVPGVGPVLVAGPLAGWIVSILENAAVFGGFTALGSGLYNLGLRRESVLTCEAALRSGSYLLLVYGSAGEVSKAKEILDLTKQTFLLRRVAAKATTFASEPF